MSRATLYTGQYVSRHNTTKPCCWGGMDKPTSRLNETPSDWKELSFYDPAKHLLVNNDNGGINGNGEDNSDNNDIPRIEISPGPTSSSCTRTIGPITPHRRSTERRPLNTVLKTPILDALASDGV